jgi:ring-1,2-phenylacetyl-CoA epoxidase subunit PaaD
VVTEAQVWKALAEVPDPEIPVISVVDLGVVRNVRVDERHVRVEFTPTFLGCPALEVMRDAMADKVRELGGEPEVEVVLDDSWSTDRITAEGREKLRAAGFAPPPPRSAWERRGNGPADEPRALSDGVASAASGPADEPRALSDGVASAASGARSATGPTLVQLQANGFRCPYCGSRDTALENIFGPTPCRSLRYCRECRQPFEQFKTI